MDLRFFHVTFPRTQLFKINSLTPSTNRRKYAKGWLLFQTTEAQNWELRESIIINLSSIFEGLTVTIIVKI